MTFKLMFKYVNVTLYMNVLYNVCDIYIYTTHQKYLAIK